MQPSDEQQIEYDSSQYYYNRDAVPQSDSLQLHSQLQNGYGYLGGYGGNNNMNQIGQQKQHISQLQMQQQQQQSINRAATNQDSLLYSMNALSGSRNPNAVGYNGQTVGNNLVNNGNSLNLYTQSPARPSAVIEQNGSSSAINRKIMPFSGNNAPQFDQISSGGLGNNPMRFAPNASTGTHLLGNYLRPEEEFTIENEDFPALPGSGVSQLNKFSQQNDSSQPSGMNVLGLGNIGMGSGALNGSIDPNKYQQSFNSTIQNDNHLGSSINQQSSIAPSFAPPQSQIGLGGYSSALNSGLNSSVSGLGGERIGSSQSELGLGGGGLGATGSGSVGPFPLVGGNNSTGSSAIGSTTNNTTQSVLPSKEVKFGLGGLLDVIRMTDKDVNTLSLGTDLTTFGLNLNSAESLYPSFSSPFADQITPPEPQFVTPSCYLMHTPSLKSEHLSKFQIETLFYMFYSMPKDILQACAAQELYRREWKYHGELKIWLKPRGPQELTQSHPNVQFSYFDVASWETRLFNNQIRGNIVQGLLTEEEVRVKVPQPNASQHNGPS
eukprot:gene6511-8949_t